ncbi:MAG: 30S ribosomal protein S11 [Patescibacteria group bacterium]|nr:30S ribosomal protein S11 [bacterium]
MGKKRIIQQSKEELLKETSNIESKLKKEVKKTSKNIGEAKIYIHSTYNNTILTLTDTNGNVLYWSSSGAVGFKGTKKGTPFAASKVAETICQTAEKMNIKKIAIVLKGIGAGRDSAIRSIAAKGFDVVSITDVTPVPHNGCRRRKPRRL